MTRRASFVLLCCIVLTACSRACSSEKSAAAGEPRTAQASAPEPTPGAGNRELRASEVEALRSLGYAGVAAVKPGTEKKLGTTVYEPDQAYRGYNLFTVYGTAEAYLQDMEGRLVHKWASDVGQPKRALETTLRFLRGWQYAIMLPDGGLLALVSRGFLLRLDWDSRVVWKKSLHVHHDVSVDRRGRIYVLTEEIRWVGDQRRLILDSVVDLLNPSGQVESSISLYDALQEVPEARQLVQQLLRSRYKALDGRTLGDALEEAVNKIEKAYPPDKAAARVERLRAFWTKERMHTAQALLDGDDVGDATFRELFTLSRSMPGDGPDILHANTVAPVASDHPDGAWQANDLLISIRNIDLVGIISHESHQLIWTWGPGVVEGQHQPSALPSGNVLMFDNGTARHRSRVIEVEPRTGQLVWTYDGGKEPFYSGYEGGVQRLPNGDTMITVSEEGRAMEVTATGKTVWEHWMPFAGNEEKRVTVYRVTRYSPEVVEPLLKR